MLVDLSSLLHYKKSKLELYKNVCENKDFFNVVVPSEDTKILEFNLYPKSDKAPFIIMQILNLCLKISMVVKIISKIHPQRKQANIFP